MALHNALQRRAFVFLGPAFLDRPDGRGVNRGNTGPAHLATAIRVMQRCSRPFLPCLGAAPWLAAMWFGRRCALRVLENQAANERRHRLAGAPVDVVP